VTLIPLLSVCLLLLLLSCTLLLLLRWLRSLLSLLLLLLPHHYHRLHHPPPTHSLECGTWQHMVTLQRHHMTCLFARSRATTHTPSTNTATCAQALTCLTPTGPQAPPPPSRLTAASFAACAPHPVP
jgi:hypothetical protein